MKTKDIKNSIKEHFFIFPKSKLRVREIERALKLPLPSVIRYCRELENEGILAVQKIGNVQFYTASRSEIYLLEKKLYNLKALYLSGLVGCLQQEMSNPVIILFGSYAKGEDTEESDIDLYIGSPSKNQASVTTYEKKLKRKIQVFQYKSIKDVPNLHLANNILNGIVLNSYIEVF